MDDTRTPRILIVDNDSSIVQAIVTRLCGAGYECLTASTGDEGVSLCATNNVVLVITDMQMPGLDGQGLISMVRTTSDVPIIVVTAYSNALQRLTRRYDNVTVLRKPFESDALMDLVEAELALAG